jgi:hypothetical protein
VAGLLIAYVARVGVLEELQANHTTTQNEAFKNHAICNFYQPKYANYFVGAHFHRLLTNNSFAFDLSALLSGRI